jgi:hypothetical protein
MKEPRASSSPEGAAGRVELSLPARAGIPPGAGAPHIIEDGFGYAQAWGWPARLDAAIRRAGSLNRFCKRAGIGRSVIHRVRYGKGCPSPAMRFRLEKALANV